MRRSQERRRENNNFINSNTLNSSNNLSPNINDISDDIQNDSNIDNFAQKNHEKILQNALEDAFLQNDILRKKLVSLNETKNNLIIELKQKNKALVELANYYNFCQKVHLKKNIEKNDAPLCKCKKICKCGSFKLLGKKRQK
jgi:hypothetical protein